VSFIQLEQDPARRQALIEELYSIKGKDYNYLPKTPVQAQPQLAQAPQPQQAPQQGQPQAEFAGQ